MEDYTIHSDVRNKFQVAVKEQLRHLVSKLHQQECSAKEIYMEQVAALQPHLASQRSNRACFPCLHSMPERVLDCGHSICETCVRSFGTREADAVHHYTLQKCPLCTRPQVQQSIRIVPPTAGVRLLSIDGGGVRGIISIIYLEAIESILEPFGCPLRDFFDLICGTSAGTRNVDLGHDLVLTAIGGIIALGICSLQWSAKQCRGHFRTLTQDTFKKRFTGSSIFARMQDFLVSYLEDGQYSQKAIEAGFGDVGTQKLFSQSCSNTKVVVTSTMAKGSRACIFTNYNGRNRHKPGAPSGYDLIRAGHERSDVTVSDA